jgi:hypothetical protein
MTDDAMPDQLLYAGETLSVYEIWERTADRHELAIIHDTKVSITVAEDLELTCSFCFEWLTNSAPLLTVRCGTSQQLTNRIQRWVDEKMREEQAWPPASRSEARNFLNHIIAHIQQRYKKIHECCAVCDKQLQLPGCKAMPCDNALCIFAFEELDYADTLHSYGADSNVPPLLVLLAHAAVSTAGQLRLAAMFSTLPTAFLKDDKTLDWTSVQAVLHTLLPARCFTTPMRDSSDSRPLLQWLLATNRSEVRPVAAEDALPNMGTDVQFKIFLGDVAAEHKFQQLKKQHGSVYAWHGSPLHNW